MNYAFETATFPLNELVVVPLEELTERSGLPRDRDTSVVCHTGNLMSTFRVQISCVGYSEYISRQLFLYYASGCRVIALVV